MRELAKSQHRVPKKYYFLGRGGATERVNFSLSRRKRTSEVCDNETEGEIHRTRGEVASVAITPF